MVWFDYVLVWSGRFHIVWCMFLVQICYHAKSGACSFKNVRVMPILVLFGMVWFGLVMFWFGLVSILIIWCVPIVQICYHAKSGACSFKNDWVIFILVLLDLVWYGVIVIILSIFTIINIVVSDILGVVAKTPGFYQVLVLSYLVVIVVIVVVVVITIIVVIVIAQWSKRAHFLLFYVMMHMNIQTELFVT